MRIAIALVQVPFITGGAEILVQMLRNELQKRGHEAEIVTIPFKWYPNETLRNCMKMGEMIDLTSVNGRTIDMVIAMKFPAYYLKHEHKVIWLMHQHRQAYDLWGTPYGDIHKTSDGEELRSLIMEKDKQHLLEAKAIFTIAQNTSKRLKHYNGIDSTALYHPPLDYEKLYCADYGEYVFYISRISSIKRQHMLINAAKYVKSDAKIIIAGSGSDKEKEKIFELIKENHLEDKVKFAGRITDEEKINYYANCLGVYFGAYDEDYGYITLESFFAKKPVIVHSDAGGPLEFVEDGVNGFIVDTTPQAVAEKIDQLFYDKQMAKRLGEQGYQKLVDMNLSWDYVIEQLIKGAGYDE